MLLSCPLDRDLAMSPERGNEGLSLVDQDLGARLRSRKHPESPPCLSGAAWARAGRSGGSKRYRTQVTTPMDRQSHRVSL